MTLFQLALKNLLFRKQSAIVSVILMAFGAALVVLILNVKSLLENEMTERVAGVDMVIGAKGSPLQLILANVFHLDNPTGNISQQAVQPFLRNPLIKESVQLAYGDYFSNTRILGVSPSFYHFYGIDCATGFFPKNDMEVAIGSSVAKKLNLKIGETFEGNHGGTAGDQHPVPFIVVGVLKPSGTVADNLIITPLASLWHVHHTNPNEREITAVLVKFKNPMGMLTLPSIINKKTTMMAALPAIEVNRLLSLFGNAITGMMYLAAIIVFTAVLSVFFSLLNSLEERKYELALMRLQGATRTQLFSLISLEAAAIGLTGGLLGLAIGKIGFYLVLHLIDFGVTAMPILPQEWFILPVAILIGTIAACVPAIKACTINITQLLKDK